MAAAWQHLGTFHFPTQVNVYIRMLNKSVSEYYISFCPCHIQCSIKHRDEQICVIYNLNQLKQDKLRLYNSVRGMNNK